MCCTGAFPFLRHPIIRYSLSECSDNARASNERRYPFRISPLACWGSAPSPGLNALRPVEHACRRGFALPLVAIFRTSALEVYDRHTGMVSTAVNSLRSSYWRCGQVSDRPPAELRRRSSARPFSPRPQFQQRLIALGRTPQYSALSPGRG